LDKNSIRLAEKTEDINSLIARSDTDILLPEGLCHFAFRRPCPVECEAYSSGVSEKQKKQKLCALCGSACPMKFMSMRSEANFIGAVNKFLTGV